MTVYDRSPKPRLVNEIKSIALTDERKKMIDDAETFAQPRAEWRWEYKRNPEDGKIIEEKRYNGSQLQSITENTYDQSSGSISRRVHTSYLYHSSSVGSRTYKPLESRDTRDYMYHDDGRPFMEVQDRVNIDQDGKEQETTGFKQMTVHVYPGEKYENEIVDHTRILTHGDQGGIIKEETYYLGSKYTTEFDGRNRPLKRIYTNGERVSSITEYSYDDRANGTYTCTEVEIRFDQSGGEKSKTMHESEHRADGKILSQVEEKNNLYTFYVYDERGNLQRAITRTTEEYGLDVSPRYVIEEYEYDFDKKTGESSRVWLEPQK